MAKYEYAHVPSSTGLLYNEKRAAYRKMMMGEGGCADGDGDGGGSESDGDGTNGKAEDGPSRWGPPDM